MVIGIYVVDDVGAFFAVYYYIGGPYWSVLVKALENDLLGHSGIASKIQKERN